jgi:hypothetical protein
MIRKLITITFLLISATAFAQLKPADTQGSLKGITYYDATQLPLLGKIEEASQPRWSRIPESMFQSIRQPLVYLGQNSAGMAVRFRSNSTRIAAKWTSLNNFSMNHMTDTGVKGLDLYCLEEGGWRFVRSGRPNGKTTDAYIIENMTAKDREFMLYLPMYDGLTELLIGVDDGSYVSAPAVDLPSREKPIVFYGTSIMQGGCSSRPGMASSNIIGRRLNRETINLGFSGNGRLDLEIARFMAKADVGVYILDFVPNASVHEIDSLMIPFFKILREAHPTVPVIFIEDPIYPFSAYDTKIAKEISDKNAMLKEKYNILKMNKVKGIYYISSKNMIGDDGEATVDGVHFTDLGFERYTDLVLPVIKKALK